MINDNVFGKGQHYFSDSIILYHVFSDYIFFYNNCNMFFDSGSISNDLIVNLSPLMAVDVSSTEDKLNFAYVLSMIAIVLGKGQQISMITALISGDSMIFFHL